MNKDNSNFEVIRDEQGKLILPKKLDGQFLFMQHIINLMLKEKMNRNKNAKACIISSSTLISTGTDSSSESKIRSHIFDMGIVEAVLEQPKAMFTNTDISSHLWFLNTDFSKRIKVVKLDTEEDELYSSHSEPKDKMKNSYSDENIEKILDYMYRTDDFKYVSKTVSNRCSKIDISNEVGFKNENENIDISQLESEIKNLA